MADVSRQELRKQRTRAAIQQAALERFTQHGYRATTINEIAQDADVAPRTVTLHFPAKEDLLFAADPFDLASFTERLRAGDDALDAVRGWMLDQMTRLTADDEDIWRRRGLRARVIAAEPALRARARAGYYEYEVALAAAIGEGLEARLAATTVVTGLRELYETPDAQDAAFDELVALVDRVLAFARRGLSDRSPSPRS